MTWKLVNAKVVDMTKALAIELSEMPSVKQERTLLQSRIALLEREFDAGRFKPFEWAVAILNGTKYRLNGQHTAHIFANGRKPHGKVLVEEFECDSEQDLAALYSMFDSKTSARTKAHIVQTVTSSEPRFNSINKTIMASTINALSCEKWGINVGGRVGNYDKAALSLDNVDFILWVADLFDSKPKMVFVRDGVIMAALAMYRENISKAYRFWEETLCATNPNPSSGTRKLREVLLTSQCRTTRSTEKKTYSRDEFANVCLAAWKAWKENRNVTYLRASKDALDMYRRSPK